MSAVFAASSNLTPGVLGGAWRSAQVRANLYRLWLPISLSIVVHLLAFAWLHNALVHDKPGQQEAGLEEGLQVRLISSSDQQNQAQLLQANSATPVSSAALPGRAPDVAERSSDSDLPAPLPDEKLLGNSAPLHPQTQVDGEAPVTGASRPVAGAASTRPQQANGAKGSFDSGYVPSTAAERAPIPLTQPDLNALSDLPRPRGTISLRAYVEQSGEVNQVIVTASQPEDQPTAEALAKAYKGVVYIAAYDHGRPVPSKIDFTITLSNSSMPGDRPESHILRKYQ